MAQKVHVTLTDDLDGGPADETVQFGLDGHWWEIDLSVVHAEQLRVFLTDYINQGRPVTKQKPAPKPPAKVIRPPSGAAGDRAAIRAWAREQGHPVHDRGRIPDALLAAYEAAH